MFYLSASPRIIELSRPLEVHIKSTSTNYEDLFKVKPQALNAVATERINELAQPKRKGRREKRRKDPFRVQAKALRAKANLRVRFLAQPRVSSGSDS